MSDGTRSRPLWRYGFILLLWVATITTPAYALQPDANGNCPAGYVNDNGVCKQLLDTVTVTGTDEDELDTVVVYGNGEWPDGLFIDWGSGYPQIDDGNTRDGVGELFSDNEGQYTGTNSAVTCGLGNPILPATGNKIEPELDFLSTGEMPLFLRRTYNRYWTYQGLFGYYWVTNFDLRIAKSPDGQTITAYRTDGRTISFRYQSTTPAGWYEVKPQAVARIVNDGQGGYILYSEDLEIETYNAGGQITSVKNQQGIGITYTYSAGRMYRATHTSGRYVQFGWTGDKVTSVTDPAGNIFQYGYSPSQLDPSLQLLGTAILPGTPSTTITYHYENVWNPGNLTGKSFNGVRYSTFGYDSANRANLSEHGGADRNTFVFSGVSGQLVTEHTNPLGRKTTYRYGVNGRLESVTGTATTYCPATGSSITYDANGYRDRVTGFDNSVTDYDYNAKGQLLKKTEGVASATVRVTTYAWDAATNRVASKTIQGLVKTDFVYLSNGRISQVKRTNLATTGAPGQIRTTTYAYTLHPNGMLASRTIDGPILGAGDTRIERYDTLGNLTRVENGLGHAFVYSNFEGNGLPRRATNENGGVTDFTYDARGRLLSETHYKGATAYTTSIVYDNRGRRTKVTTPDGVATSFSYDYANRLLLKTRPNANSAYASLGTNLVEFERYSYSANSDVTKVERGVRYLPNPAIVSNGSAESLTGAPVGDGIEPMACFPQPDCEPGPDPEEPEEVWLTTWRQMFDYDELGRVRAARGNNGQITKFTYDGKGRALTVVDVLNRQTTRQYDALGRLYRSTDFAGGMTEYTYDALDSVTRVKDPRGLITSYAVDGFGQMWSTTSPDTGTTTYQYDAAGLLSQMTRANGTWLSYDYDSAGRLTAVGDSNESRTYTYDSCIYGKGRLCWAGTNLMAWSSYTYTPSGMIATRHDGVYGADDATTFTYDGMDRLTNVAYPGGVSVGYAYANGNVSSVTANIGGANQTVLNNVKVQPFGAPSAWTYGNGLNRNTTHDLDGRRTGISVGNGTVVRQSLGLQFNALDQITKITNGIDAAATQTIGYDAVGQVKTVATASANSTFYYDLNGNRTSRVDNGVTATSTIAAGSNRLTWLASPSIARNFDINAVGNVTSYAGTDGVSNLLFYDSFNRVESHGRNGGSLSYTYNALDERVGKFTSAAGGTRFINSEGLLLAENRSNAWTHYLWAGGELLGLVRNNQLYYVHADQVGRPEIVTNSAKTTVWRSVNTAFGRAVANDQIGGLNIGFPGQYWDAESGLFHNGFRSYEPTLGRYMQSDPIGLAGGLNPFLYVRNNPVSLIDPTGLTDPWVVVGKVGESLHHGAVRAGGVGLGLTIAWYGGLATGHYVVNPLINWSTSQAVGHSASPGTIIYDLTHQPTTITATPLAPQEPLTCPIDLNAE